MPVTIADLVDDAALGLRQVVGDGAATISWVHSSDLRDPTPFLDAGHLLLTTGPQLEQGLGDYVVRLAEAGVAGIGIGTGFAWPQPPAKLVHACESRGLDLVEVPYAVPFIAVSRWVADALAAEAQARDHWGVHAQRTVSLAALSPRRLDGVLDELARQLEGEVLLFDTTTRLLGHHGRKRVPDLDLERIRAEARRLLRRNSRAASAMTEPGHTVALETLGRRGELRGVLATVTRGRGDAATTAVITGAVALTELSLEDTARHRLQQAAVDGQLLRLLLEGERSAVDRILAGGGRRLPDEPLRLVATDQTNGAEITGPPELLRAAYEDLVLLVLNETALPQVLTSLGSAAGVSRQATYASLHAAISGARRALRRSTPGRPVTQDDDQPVLGLLPRDEVTDLARLRLRRLLDAPDADDLLQAAETWLRHNAAYDPAARELGLHRHTVKASIRRVRELTDLELDSFGGKAELWALLQSR